MDGTATVLGLLMRARPGGETEAVDGAAQPEAQQPSVREGDPLAGLSRGERDVLGVLMFKPFGVTARSASQIAGVSYSHACRCLNRLRNEGLATLRRAMAPLGCESAPANLWSLSWSARCVAALQRIDPKPPRGVPRADPDMVPPDFWRCFWSGAPANELRVSEHGLHIAETLLGGRDVCAVAWALTELPVEVLEECRTLTGYDAGEHAEMISSALLARRSLDARH